MIAAEFVRFTIFIMGSRKAGAKKTNRSATQYRAALSGPLLLTVIRLRCTKPTIAEKRAPVNERKYVALDVAGANIMAGVYDKKDESVMQAHIGTNSKGY